MPDTSDSYFLNKSFLVTGAGGFLGSHLVDALLAVGATVIGVDNFITGRLENIAEAKKNSNFTFIEADVSQDPENYLASGVVLDGVFHLASPASPPHYQAAPVATYMVNSFATHYLATYLHDRFPAARLLFASTSEVYGDPLEHPQTESYWGNVNPNGARSCYDESKRLGETICGVFNRDLGLDTRIIRIFNTYGPRINPSDKRVIPDFIAKALANQPLQIFGDGSQTRSYCFVSDLIRGIMAMMAASTAAGETVNLGNPDEKTVLETARAIIAATGSSSTLEYHPLPADDPTRRKPNISKANTLLGWNPQLSFDEGIAQTIAYFKEFEL